MKMQMKNYMLGPTRQWCVYFKNSFMFIYPTEKVAEISVFFTEAQNFTEMSLKFQWPVFQQ